MRIKSSIVFLRTYFSIVLVRVESNITPFITKKHFIKSFNYIMMMRV